MPLGHNRVLVGEAHDPAPGGPQSADFDAFGHCGAAPGPRGPSGGAAPAAGASDDGRPPQAPSSDGTKSSAGLSPTQPASSDAEDLTEDPRPSLLPLHRRWADEEPRPPPPPPLRRACLAWPRFGVLGVCLVLAALAFMFAQGQQLHRLVPPREVMALFSKEAILSANSHEKRAGAFDRVAIGLYYAVGGLSVLNFAVQLLVLPLWEVRRARRGGRARADAGRCGAFFKRLEPGGRFFWYRFAVVEGVQGLLQIGRLCVYGGFDVVAGAQVTLSHVHVKYQEDPPKGNVDKALG